MILFLFSRHLLIEVLKIEHSILKIPQNERFSLVNFVYLCAVRIKGEIKEEKLTLNVF